MQRPRQLGEHEQPQEERWLSQAGKGDLPCGAHTLEGGARVEGCRGREEPAEAKEIRQQNQVTRERDRSAGINQGNKENGHCRRHQANDRPGTEHPGRGFAEDGPFAKELDEVVVRLQYGRPNPPGEKGLGLVDDAQEERRECQGD